MWCQKYLFYYLCFDYYLEWYHRLITGLIQREIKWKNFFEFGGCALLSLLRKLICCKYLASVPFHKACISESIHIWDSLFLVQKFRRLIKYEPSVCSGSQEDHMMYPGASGRTHLEHGVEFGALQYKKDMRVLEVFKWGQRTWWRT